MPHHDTRFKRNSFSSSVLLVSLARRTPILKICYVNVFVQPRMKMSHTLYETILTNTKKMVDVVLYLPSLSSLSLDSSADFVTKTILRMKRTNFLTAIFTINVLYHFNMHNQQYIHPPTSSRHMASSNGKQKKNWLWRLLPIKCLILFYSFSFKVILFTFRCLVFEKFARFFLCHLLLNFTYTTTTFVYWKILKRARFSKSRSCFVWTFRSSGFGSEKRRRLDRTSSTPRCGYNIVAEKINTVFWIEWRNFSNRHISSSDVVAFYARFQNPKPNLLLLLGSFVRAPPSKTETERRSVEFR